MQGLVITNYLGYYQPVTNGKQAYHSEYSKVQKLALAFGEQHDIDAIPSLARRIIPFCYPMVVLCVRLLFSIAHFNNRGANMYARNLAQSLIIFSLYQMREMM